MVEIPLQIRNAVCASIVGQFSKTMFEIAVTDLLQGFVEKPKAFLHIE
jgi:hypothetical protein